MAVSVDQKKVVDKKFKEELYMLDEVIKKIDRFNKELKSNRKAIDSRFGLFRKSEYMSEFLGTFCEEIDDIRSKMRENDLEINLAKENDK